KKAGHKARLKSNREVEGDESFLKSSPSRSEICAVGEWFKADFRIAAHGRYAICECLVQNGRIPAALPVNPRMDWQFPPRSADGAGTGSLPARSHGRPRPGARCAALRGRRETPALRLIE